MKKKKKKIPSSSGHPSQQESFGIVIEIHDAGCFEPLSDPVALLQRIDEHKLDANVTAISRFQSIQNLLQRQRSFVWFSDERSGRQFENTVHIPFIYRKPLVKHIPLTFIS